MMSKGESLSKHLYDAANGNIQTSLTRLNHATTPITIATPASGKKIAILFLAIMPSTADNKVDLSWWVGAVETAIFVDLHNNAVISPVLMNLSSCPIMGPADGVLKGVNSGGASVVDVTVNYVELT
jgi:hypothetical protein